MPDPRVNLDSPPPLPPGGGRRPSLEGLAGPQQGALPPTQDMVSGIVERGAFIDQRLQEFQQILPELSPQLDDLRTRLRAILSQAINQQAQGAAPPDNQAAQLMGMLGGGAAT